MDFEKAQHSVDQIVKHYGEYWKPLSQLARLTEEVGELARAMNIKYGEKKSKHTGDGREIEKELADVLITVFAIANSLNIDMSKEFENKIKDDFKKMEGVYTK